MKTEEFRGKRVDNGEWVHGHYFKTPLTDENSGTESSAGWFFLTGETRHCISNANGSVFVVDPATIGRASGETARYGASIYQGDFVKSETGKIHPVVFQNACFTWDNEPLCYSVDDGKLEYTDPSKWASVIGNIHDNPELLK